MPQNAPVRLPGARLEEPAHGKPQLVDLTTWVEHTGEFGRLAKQHTRRGERKATHLCADRPPQIDFFDMPTKPPPKSMEAILFSHAEKDMGHACGSKKRSRERSAQSKLISRVHQSARLECED